NISGIDYSKFKMAFTADLLRQEEVVNMGYKSLVFDAFLPSRAGPITERGPLDPLANYNLVVSGKITEISNELFARGENLIDSHLPKFDPKLFGKQGKVMDSW